MFKFFRDVQKAFIQYGLDIRYLDNNVLTRVTVETITTADRLPLPYVATPRVCVCQQASHSDVFYIQMGHLIRLAFFFYDSAYSNKDVNVNAAS